MEKKEEVAVIPNPPVHENVKLFTSDEICTLLQLSPDAKAGFLVDRGYKYNYDHEKWKKNFVCFFRNFTSCQVIYSIDTRLDYVHIILSKDEYSKFLEQFPTIQAFPINSSVPESITKISDKCAIRAAGYMIEDKNYRIEIFHPKVELPKKEKVEKIDRSAVVKPNLTENSGSKVLDTAKYIRPGVLKLRPLNQESKVLKVRPMAQTIDTVGSKLTKSGLKPLLPPK